MIESMVTATAHNLPRNVNWTSEGCWVRWAKLAFAWSFIREVKQGVSESRYAKAIMKMSKIRKIQGR